MNGAITKMTFFILFVAVWVFVPMGYSYANSLPEGQFQLVADRDVRTEVEIYRRESFPSYKSKMLELCRRLEADSADFERNQRSDVEVYQRHVGPGTTEYRREYRVSRGFADPVSEERTLELCRRLESSVPFEGPARSETHIYRETTVPE